MIASSLKQVKQRTARKLRVGVIGGHQRTLLAEKLIGLLAIDLSTVHQLSAEEVHLSDHIAVTMNFKRHIQLQPRGRLQQQPLWSKPSFLSRSQWKDLISQAWFSKVQSADMQTLLNLDNNEIDVNTEWKAFMTVLSEVFLQATRAAATIAIQPEQEQELWRLLHQPGIRHGKGMHSPVLHSSAPANRSQEDKVLSRKWARLCSLARLLRADVQQDRRMLCDCRRKVQNLVGRLWNNFYEANTAPISELLKTSFLRSKHSKLNVLGGKVLLRA